LELTRATDCEQFEKLWRRQPLNISLGDPSEGRQMKANRFLIASSWEAREESPSQIGQRMLRSLDALTSVCPFFRPWWFADLSLSTDKMSEMMDEGAPPEDFCISLDDVRDSMAEMVERGMVTDDSDEPDPGGGYSISAHNTMRTSPQSVGLRAHGGGRINKAYPNAGLRYANFETAYGEPPDPAIVAYPVFRQVLLTIVSNWEVDYAQAYSHEIMDAWRPIPWRRYFDLSWMTYLSARLAKQITPPTDVLTERTPDGGLLMIAAEETFDVANPRHMAAARSIVKSLTPFNAPADDKDRSLIGNWPKGSMLSRLLDFALRFPEADRTCLDDVATDYKQQIKSVITEHLARYTDEKRLERALRDIGTFVPTHDVSLRDELERMLTWLS